VDVADPADLAVARRLKLVASALIAVPAAVLIVFAIGEMAGGEISGIQHVPEAALLLLLMAAGWRYPRAVGATLAALGVLFFALWLFAMAIGGDPDFRGWGILLWVTSGLVIFAPPVVAGWLFLRAASLASHTGSR
jgi:hypothetical protein